MFFFSFYFDRFILCSRQTDIAEENEEEQEDALALHTKRLAYKFSLSSILPHFLLLLLLFDKFFSFSSHSDEVVIIFCAI